MKVKQQISKLLDADMKTTVPNSSTSTMSNSRTGKGGQQQDANNNKALLEKELEEVTRQLKGMTNSNGKNDSNIIKLVKAGGTNELKLWEQKILLMLKLKQWTNVCEEGYKILGKKGPSITIYKCILVSLCRLGKFDDVVELLEQWKRNVPKCGVMLDTKQKIEGYLTAIRSGVDVTKLLLNIEEVIKVGDSASFHSQSSSGSILAVEPNWKYRPFPQRHNTFSLCPRIASGVACMYGNECLSAHSKEELKEWQQRILWKNNKSAITSLVASSTVAAVPAPPPQKSSIPKEQIPISYRILPPACMYYLAGLVKRVQESKNLKTLFVDSLPDVKIKLSCASAITKRLGSKPVLNNHKWSYMIASKRPLATVTLLHDQYRDRFAITGAFFFNNPKRATLDLIELHPNNKSQKGIQVLNTFIRPELFLPFNNGWPDWCCYQIDVVFQTPSQSTGKFGQDIIFDFKSDPKISKRIEITLEPPPPLIAAAIQQKIEPPQPIINSNNNNNKSAELLKPTNKISTSSSTSSAEEAILERGGILEKDFRDTVLLNIPPRPQLNNNNNNTKENNNNNIIPNPNNNSPSSTSGGSLSQSLSDCEENLEEDFKSSNNNSSSKNNLNINKQPPIMSMCNGHGEKKDVNSSSSPLEEEDNAGHLLVRQWVNGTEASYNQLIEDLEDEQLTKENYVSWMSRFLQCEIKAREQELLKLSVKSEINIYNPSNTGFNAVGLFGKLFLAKDVNEKDSKIGRLINNNCSSISIGELNSAVISKPKTFACRVINKTEQAIIILIGRTAVEELKLSPGSSRKLDIWLHLDHSYLDLLKAVLQGMTEHHLQFLFPTFPPKETQQLWDFNSLVNSSIPKFELDETLNSKQRDALHAILSNLNSKEAPSIAPVIITGPPSSGKSHLIARSIMSILSNSKKSSSQLNRILICTFTNKAADEFITEHFSSWLSQSNVDESCLLRIYHAEQSPIDAGLAVKEHCLLVNDANSFRYPTLEELLTKRIIIVTVSTCLELLQLGLPDYIFSHIFIDECHRMIEAESLCPILHAGKSTRIVVAGDNQLLNPETFTLPTLTSKCKEITLIDRLNHVYPQRHPFRIRLDEMYNINQDIVQFISSEFYSSSVKCAKSPLDHPTYHPLSFSIVQGGEDCQPDHGDGFYNMKEIYEIRDRLTEVIKAWPESWGSYKDKHSIAVITPYPDQAMGIRIKLKLEGLSFVDVAALPNVLSKQYRVVIISPVRAFKNVDHPDNVKLIRESDAGGGFYTNTKAIYTALTRAQNMAIVVGDLVGLCNIGICTDIWRQFVSVCRKNNSVLGLSPTFDNSGGNSGPFQEKKISPRPSLFQQNLKKSDQVSTSSPNLDCATTRNSDPYLLSHGYSVADDKSGSLQKLRNLSSIWNTPDPLPTSTPSPKIHSNLSSSVVAVDNNNIKNVEPGGSSVLSYSNIWGGGEPSSSSANTGSLGNLSDPSAIWGSGLSKVLNNGDIYRQGAAIGCSISNNNIYYAKPIMTSSKLDEKSNNSSFANFNSSFDLPPDSPVSRNGNNNNAQITPSTCSNPIVGSSISSSYRPVLPQPQQSTSNLPELLRLPNPLGNVYPSSIPTLNMNSNTGNPCWPIMASPFGLTNNSTMNTCTSQNQTLVTTNTGTTINTNNYISQQQGGGGGGGLTSFEIAQANYAYNYHGPPRRLGYNPPPRMLRTYRPLGQLTQYGSSTPMMMMDPAEMEFNDNYNSNLINSTGYAKESPKNFDFFKELDLNSVPASTTVRKSSISSVASSSSQDYHEDEIDGEGGHVSNKNGQKFKLDSSEFPDLGTNKAGTASSSTTPSSTNIGGATGWIEVKSTKKGGAVVKKDSEHEVGSSQKKKTKKKSSTTISTMSTVPFGTEGAVKVLSVDQMIESLKEMGFKKREAIKALQMCNRDLERAVEWLIING